MSNRLDLSLIERDLVKEAQEPAGPMRWLRESYEQPDPFSEALLAANGALFSWPGKSRLHWKYDFFHDIFARNRQNPAPAFRWFEKSRGWQDLSYDMLGRLAAGKASQWEKRGAAAGMKICLVSHLGERFLTALLAALKIGMTVSLLPPWGRAFLQRRIDAVCADFVWTTEEHAPLLESHRKILLVEGGTGRVEGEDSRSHSYAASDTFALLFDPTWETVDVPRELSAESAYLCAVRDGLVAFSLKPGQRLAAPGFPFMETQPALLLACLMNGATYVHLSERDISNDPKLLIEQPFRAVGITSGVREMLLENPVEIGKAWNFWFRDPAESQDVEAWTDFVEALRLRDVLSANCRWNASLGGCILFSVRRKGAPHRNVLPAAGVPWHLADPADKSLFSLWSHGSFAVQVPGGEKEGAVAGGMLAESRNEWIFIRPVLVGRAGRYYPAQEVLDGLAGNPYGSSCSMVEVPASRSDGSSRYVLLVFAGGKRISEASVSESLRMKIMREMGKEFLPDVIRIIALHPRRGEDGSIDHEWCGKEFLSGGIARRTKGEVFRRITELRDLIHGSS
ncbi:MAG: hypothetical protein LLG06_13560 [Desulfobacteraceae bacterium]|nr:hypothetical protein [Desulfobacteraceae bacterium]